MNPAFPTVRRARGSSLVFAVAVVTWSGLLGGRSGTAEPKSASELPRGVAFRLDGRDLAEEDFVSFVGAEYRATPKGRALLDSVAQEVVIDSEARRRGLAVTDAEVDARIRRVDQETRRESGGAKDLAAVLREQDVEEAEFRLLLRKSIVLEKVVREEFGTQEVSDAKVTVWLQDRMRRAAVVTSVASPTLVARVDGEPVTTAAFGRRYLAQFPKGGEERRRIENEFLRATLAQRFGAEVGVTLLEDDVRRAIDERERALRERPGFQNVTLDQFLHKTGSSVSELAARPSFRTQVLLRRVIDEAVFPGPEIYWLYRSHKSAFDKTYGRSADLSTIFLQAGSAGAATAGYVRRTFEDAEAELNALKRRLEEGRADFAAVAAARSDHESAKARGELGWINEASGDLAELAGAALESDATFVGPVRASDGMHLLWVRGRRDRPGFLELEPAIRRHAIQILLDARSRRAQVERAR